jgi:peptidoglycan hydrolase-like protein with peptidoglycan-binding domain
MFNEDVKDLYSIVPVGTQVTILNGCFGSFGSGFADINPGDRGSDVLAIQHRLSDLGYFKGRFTGIYEDDLKKAVHNFQKKSNLQVKNTITKKDYLVMGFRDFE